MKGKTVGWILFYIAFLFMLIIIGWVFGRRGHNISNILAVIFFSVLVLHIFSYGYKQTKSKFTKACLVFAGFIFVLNSILLFVYIPLMDTIKERSMWVLIGLVCIALIRKRMAGRKKTITHSWFKKVKKKKDDEIINGE